MKIMWRNTTSVWARLPGLATPCFTSSTLPKARNIYIVSAKLPVSDGSWLSHGTPFVVVNGDEKFGMGSVSVNARLSPLQP